tara:strand:+ start:1576 stop:1893 length:318 start_codon:yes stop_codon:yes gene_type:complete
MENKSPTRDQKNEALLKNNDTSAATQRHQIVALLNKFQSQNTPELRKHGIMAPAPRIFELRQMGYNIAKVLETYIDETGKVHHGVARYYFANNPPADYLAYEVAA